MERVAIVGSRPPHRDASQAFKDRWWATFKPAVETFVDGLPDGTMVVSGRAAGVDSIAEARARERGLEVLPIEADWRTYGKSAGYRRNEKIVETSSSVVAFWNSYSPGTGHTIDIARRERKLDKIVRLSALEVYTARMGLRDPDVMNIARKQGHLAFAPSWELLAPYLERRRAGLETDQDWVEYTAKYLDEMRSSFGRNAEAWRSLLARERVVVTCFCTSERCHRFIFAETVLRAFGVAYKGELTA